MLCYPKMCHAGYVCDMHGGNQDQTMLNVKYGHEPKPFCAGCGSWHTPKEDCAYSKPKEEKVEKDSERKLRIMIEHFYSKVSTAIKNTFEHESKFHDALDELCKDIEQLFDDAAPRPQEKEKNEINSLFETIESNLKDLKAILNGIN